MSFDPTRLPPPAGRYVGTSVQRVEDDRLLIGEGRFVADYEPPGVLHAAFLRSTVPHGRISALDVDAARHAPGVIAVFTGEDMVRLTHPFTPLAMLPGLYSPLHWSLAVDKVRMVGDPVAMVVAENRYLAEDALEAITVSYEPLDAVPDIATALSADSAQLWERADGNLLYDDTTTIGDVDAVFARADRVITERLRSHRQSNQPMETRGIVVEVDDDGRLTVTAATQSSHLLRWALAALTGRRSTTTALKSFITNKQRRSSLAAAVKQFVGDNRADRSGTSSGDGSAGPKAQMKREPATLKHMAAMMSGLVSAEDFPRVQAQDIGGGFGSKIAVHREDVAVTAAAIELGRAVKWIEDRSESLLDGGHARDEDLTVSIAFDEDGTLRGLKVDLVIDQGAYPGFPFSASGNAALMRAMFPGAYDFEAFEMRSRTVATNKGRYLAYRGPWANETWGRERLLDLVARELHLDPAELRLRNMIGDDLPRDTLLTGAIVDETFSVKRTLRQAVEVIDRAAFETQRTEAAGRNHLLGIGFACYHEAAPGPPGFMGGENPGADLVLSETARTTITRDGRVVVFTPQMPHGQSHQTTYLQLVADELGVAMDDVELVWGDTDRTPFSLLGTGGSRGGPVGGGAIRYSARAVRKQIVDRAAQLLEAAASDIDIVDGNAHVRGVPAKGMAFAEIAASMPAAIDGAPAFEFSQPYRGKGDGGWSCATHVCIVDIDLDTGRVAIPRYVVVEDCGPVINPAVVDGQIRGAVAQGVGSVLYEQVAFDALANPLATTYMDYLLPTTTEVPLVEIHHLESLSPGENDHRGVGEGGFIAAPAAITNAIDDALAAIGGKRVTDQHLPPDRILELARVLEP